MTVSEHVLMHLASSQVNRLSRYRTKSLWLWAASTVAASDRHNNSTTVKTEDQLTPCRVGRLHKPTDWAIFIRRASNPGLHSNYTIHPACSPSRDPLRPSLTLHAPLHAYYEFQVRFFRTFTLFTFKCSRTGSFGVVWKPQSHSSLVHSFRASSERWNEKCGASVKLIPVVPTRY